jgi:hypothetical protein
MTYREARVNFTYALAQLVMKARELGFEAAFAEGMDRKTLKDPTTDHMKGSLHELGLAQDVDLYKDGVYLTQTADHVLLGQWWESYGVLMGWPLVWGGRFTHPDGNHYSHRWGGKS